MRHARFWTSLSVTEWGRCGAYFPITHAAAFKRELAERYPELPHALFDVFETSRKLAARRSGDAGIPPRCHRSRTVSPGQPPSTNARRAKRTS